MPVPSKPRGPSVFRRLIRGYQSAALIALNTVVLFLAINIALLAFFHVKDRLSAESPVTKKYGMEVLRDAYPHRSESEIEALLSETWSRKFIYEPYTQFAESPRRGDYVNVHDAGFRLGVDQGPWPPQAGPINVFVFGGSTTFGYGVADDETIPSYLQRELATLQERPVHVYNFGRGHYFSTQERILFTQLIAAGHAPDLAVFIDGLNDFYYAAKIEPHYTRRLRRVTQDPKSRALELLSELPLARALRAIRVLPRGEPTPQAVAFDDDGVIEGAVGRYLASKRIVEALAESRGIVPVFVWQPVPTFGYDLTEHPFDLSPSSPHNYSKYGYAAMGSRRDGGRLGANFVWCADLQRDQEPPFYVDVVHYSAQFSERIATCIATGMVERGIPDLLTGGP